mgnify:CR=1 FL=1
MPESALIEGNINDISLGSSGKVSPYFSVIRFAKVVAPLTEICWPKIALIENSNISQQPGKRSP